jgi:hypothetical protein
MAQKLTEWMFIVLAFLGLLLTACGASGGEMRDPFSARCESEDGIVVEWSGYTEGYQPGYQPEQHDEVYLHFENESDERWKAKYCIQLLDSQDVVATLGQREFVLDPGAAMGTPHVLDFPGELAEGAYGLALVVHRPQGSMVNNVTIRIGDTDDFYRSQESANKAALYGCPPAK